MDDLLKDAQNKSLLLDEALKNMRASLTERIRRNDEFIKSIISETKTLNKKAELLLKKMK